MTAAIELRNELLQKQAFNDDLEDRFKKAINDFKAGWTA